MKAGEFSQEALFLAIIISVQSGRLPLFPPFQRLQQGKRRTEKIGEYIQENEVYRVSGKAKGVQLFLLTPG